MLRSKKSLNFSTQQVYAIGRDAQLITHGLDFYVPEKISHACR